MWAGGKEITVDTVIERCCGLDVHKDTVVACVRTTVEGGKRNQETKTFGTTTTELLKLKDWIAACKVSLVGMDVNSGIKLTHLQR